MCPYSSGRSTKYVTLSNSYGKSIIYAIGNSSKHPWPKRKKPTEPESTIAITMIFLPCLRTANGLGRQGGRCGWSGTAVAGVEENPNSCRTLAKIEWSTSDSVADAFWVARPCDSWVRPVLFLFFSGTTGLLRGCIGGSSGSPAKRWSNSARVGMGVF
jgi:hypothetical protein